MIVNFPSCETPDIKGKFSVDLSKSSLDHATPFFEGTNPYRAKANIPSSISWSQIERVVVANGPS